LSIHSLRSGIDKDTSAVIGEDVDVSKW